MLTGAALLLILTAPGAPQGRDDPRAALVLAEDRRASAPGDYERLVAAASRGNVVARARAIRALGRLEQRHPSFDEIASLLQRALVDRNAMIRRAAAYALAQSVTARDAGARAPQRRALLTALARERNVPAAAALMESAARLADTASIAEVESAILARATAASLAGGAASALEVLSRRAGRDGRLGDASIAWLRAAALAPATSPPARREAVLALTASRAIDAATAAVLLESRDWQIRRLAVLAAPSDAALIARALEDPDGHVRLEGARLFGRSLLPAASCAPLIQAARDADTHVALAAIDALARCEDTTADEPLAALAASPGGAAWHRASHALVSLASRDRPRARALLAAHMEDAAWPVRMYAADAAAAVLDDQALETLAGDTHPNVRQAAIRGLTARAGRGVATGFPPDLEAGRRARLRRAIAAALTDLRDPQLILTAAAGVKESGDPASLSRALLDAIAALDAEGAETTIDARVALVDALKIAAPGTPAPEAPPARAPETPSAQELGRLPVRARVEMARGGAFELALLPDEAPATVARFARLARAGYYDGLTFHRVVPNFVVQGGSPWANEYAGAARFQRDEVGFARHERGAVGISTRGRDTGDAQIFIDLVDLPRLNHDYTVFARVVAGMDVVDEILEADVIRSVAIVK